MTSTEQINKDGKKPKFLWFATEAFRAIAELGLSVPYRRLYKSCEEGDGHPVLVLPGFMASDFSTGPMRDFIDSIGYHSSTWDLGRNYGKVSFIDDLVEKLESLYKEHKQPVTIIGWSLGGVYARQLAKNSPKLVRQVITLGSPFCGIAEPNNASWLYNLLPGRKRIVDLDPELLNDLPKPAPVPTTAIYSKEDGMVPWEVCLEKEETSIHQNIQVRGSHLGLGVNPSVLEIIANRLQYSEANWEHFRAPSIVKDLLFYPSL